MYDDHRNVEALIQAFEDLTLPQSEWTHSAHLTVCLFYLMKFDDQEAVWRTRNGIQRLNACYGVEMTPDSGYHETITLFWLWYGRQFLNALVPPGDMVAAVNRFIKDAADKRIPLQYYSRDLIMSWAARTSWLEPDLQPMETVEG